MWAKWKITFTFHLLNKNKTNQNKTEQNNRKMK